MIQYICDGCEEIMTAEPALMVLPNAGIQTHFHGHKCLATWAADMAATLNSVWMRRPE